MTSSPSSSSTKSLSIMDSPQPGKYDDYGAIPSRQNKGMKSKIGSSLSLSSPQDHLITRSNGRRSILLLLLVVLGLAFLLGSRDGSLPTATGNDDTFMESSSTNNRMEASLLQSPQGSPNQQTKETHDENTPLFYHRQLVDHFGTSSTSGSSSSSSSSSDEDDESQYWSHRYYLSTRFYKGPGSPILLVIGGEGALNHGMLYPFVTDVLAKALGAAVVQPEHRFYGPYPPLPTGTATIPQLLDLLTPSQAMADMLRLVQTHLQKDHPLFQNCSNDRSSVDYCPLITIGGSYPGFLSAMFRLVYPDIVDMAYASSAPLKMYAQTSPNTIYYDIVTAAAEKASPGCAHAVHTTLIDITEEIKAAASLHEAAILMGVCPDTLPSSLTTQQDLIDSIQQVAVYSFADYDMTCYPPSNHTGMYNICQSFQDPAMNSIDTLKAFFNAMLIQQYEDEQDCSNRHVTCPSQAEELEEIMASGNKTTWCFDLDDDSAESLEDGMDTSIEGHPYNDGYMWNFQTCTNLIFLAGQSNASMFPTKPATYNDLTKECQAQFGPLVTPRPWELVDKWGFDDLVGAGASRMLFTNGMQDMWSGGSPTSTLVPNSLVALNFENGAHHSDLNHAGPSSHDTPDIQQGYRDITRILEGWIADVKAEATTTG